MSSYLPTNSSLRTWAAVGAGVAAGGYALHCLLRYFYVGSDPVGSECFRRYCPRHLANENHILLAPSIEMLNSPEGSDEDLSLQ